VAGSLPPRPRAVRGCGPKLVAGSGVETGRTARRGTPQLVVTSGRARVVSSRRRWPPDSVLHQASPSRTTGRGGAQLAGRMAGGAPRQAVEMGLGDEFVGSTRVRGWLPPVCDTLADAGGAPMGRDSRSQPATGWPAPAVGSSRVGGEHALGLVLAGALGPTEPPDRCSRRRDLGGRCRRTASTVSHPLLDLRPRFGKCGRARSFDLSHDRT